ncbi:receptor-interacting serine/threonine-protein kinase 1 isoform X3 [Agrilus planipennis]|uniref:Receptor-interacting serine/threonine-protein kinase 1 isoform X3 n=1 Tax=Agrilus planipennis TaxID=224129 RepID=A0A7F5RN32_AGRPL|nr:receptor-interacting serine/threonine-protein kinase 1 isoform X3 [Agrilus planipennis]
MSNSGDLVLDACPSPPRIDHSNNINEKNENGKEETAPNEDDFIPKKPKSKTKKSKKHGNQGSVNLLTIKNCHGFQVGPTFVVNGGSADTNLGKKESIVMTKEIQNLFESNNHLNRQDLIFVSAHMGKGWENVARALEYSEGQIFQFHTDFIKSGIKEKLVGDLSTFIGLDQNKAK